MLLKLNNTSGRKDTADLSQFYAIPCREYTQVRDIDFRVPRLSHAEVGTQKLGQCWKVQLLCKVNTELRSESCPCAKTIPHSRVRISHGFNKLVTNWNNNEQETSEVKFEEYALKLDARGFCKPIKEPKQNDKDQNLLALPHEPYLLGKELGPMLNLENIQSPIMKVSKKLVHLLRHGSLPRENDGAIEFLRIEDKSSETFLVLSSLV